MTDPRANEPQKLTPPEPLPYVSRSALKRVKNPLPRPVACPYCDGLVELVNNAEIYNGREYGDWPFAYLCRPCDAYVGLHPNTDIPLGTLADADLRHKRKGCKATFHELLDASGWSRSQGYAWLAAQMGIPTEECHWGWFGKEECIKAKGICKEKLNAGDFGTCDLAVAGEPAGPLQTALERAGLSKSGTYGGGE